MTRVRVDRSRLFWLLTLAVPPLVVYGRTMAPGLLARGDTPKFQFLGSVLGTAHAPGYPLYIELSWLASRVPIGSVAGRVNAMTMIFGVIAAMFTGVAARRLGAGRSASLVAGLGLAFGPVFWAQATAAEVYTLAAALFAAVVALLARWQDSRSDRLLLAAVAVASLALGHHPTFAMTVPALVTFVLLVDWRVLTRPRLIAGVFAIVALGFSQYLYVVIRTHHGAPYLEATAAGLGDLVTILRGAQFHDAFFAFTPGELLHARLPEVCRVVYDELGIGGLVLAVVGAVWLALRNWRALLLLVIAGGTTFAFTCIYRVADFEVFAITTFLTMWILAAIGLGGVSRVATRDGVQAAALAAFVAVVLAAVAVTRSFAREDVRAASRADEHYFSAFMRQIETPAAVFSMDADPASHAVRYESLAAHAAPGFIRVADADESEQPALALRGRRATYTFESGRRTLESRGLLLATVTLADRLTDRLAQLPAHATVAVVSTPGVIGQLDADDVEFLRRLKITDLSAPFATIVRDGVPHMADRRVPARVELAFDRSKEPALIAESDDNGGAIRLGDRDVLRARDGLLVAAFAPDASVEWADVVDRPAGFVPALPMQNRPLYRVTGGAPCRDLPKAGSAAFSAADAIGFRFAPWVHGGRAHTPARLTAYAGTDDDPARFVGVDAAGVAALLATEVFDARVPGTRDRLAARAAQDGAALTITTRYVARAEYAIETGDDGEALGSLVTVPRPASLVFAVRADAGAQIRVCARPVGGLVLFGDPSERPVDLLHASAEFVGDGWAGSTGGEDAVRWMQAPRGHLQFTLPTPMPLSIRMSAKTNPATATGTVGLEVNGHPLESRTLVSAGEYRWSVPVTTLLSGYNSIAVVSSAIGGGQPPALGASSIVLSRSHP